MYKQSDKKFTHLKDVIILDTGSPIEATFMNPDLVKNIYISNQPIEIKTNAESKIMNMEGTVPGFGTVYFDPTQITKNFIFGCLTKMNYMKILLLFTQITRQ